MLASIIIDLVVSKRLHHHRLTLEEEWASNISQFSLGEHLDELYEVRKGMNVPHL